MNQLLKLPFKFLKKIPMLFSRRHYKKTYRKLIHLEFDQLKLARQLGHLNRHFRHQPKSRKLLLIGSLLLITLTPLAIFLARNPKEVRSWWNDNWQYRIKTTITEASGGSLTDFQVAITLDTASLITAGKMQADCDDIRVYDTTNITPQNYWVDTCNSATTYIWMKQSFSASESKAFYIYYGNPSAINAEADGGDIFKFFDDFDGPSLKSSWTEVTLGGASPGTFSSSTWTKTCNGECDWWNSTDLDAAAYVDFPLESGSDQTWEAVARMTSAPGTGNRNMGMLLYQAARDGYMWVYSPANSRYEINLTGSSGLCSISSTTQPANLKIRKTTANGVTNNNSFDFWLNTGSGWTQCGTYNPSDIMGKVGLFIKDWDSNSTSATFDYFYLKKYAASEPTSSNTSEESATGPVGYWKFDESTNISQENPLTTIEQQINIMDQVYYQAGTSYGPSDNSLGIFHYDADRYPGATIYLEVAIKPTFGQSNTAYAALYDTAGNQVTGSETTGGSIGVDDYYLVRSSALTLTDDTDYTVKIKNSTSSWSTYLASARLIISQSNPIKLSATQTNIEIGAAEKQTSSTSTILTSPTYYYFDSTKFSPTPTVTFDAALRGSPPTIEQQINIMDQVYSQAGTSYGPSDNSLGIFHYDADKYPGATIYVEVAIQPQFGTANTAYAALYDTAGNQVSGSEITGGSVTVNDYALVRSSALTLTDDTDYTVRIKNSNASNTTYLSTARLIVVQSDTTKIQRTETQIEVGNYQAAITSTSYSELTNPKYYMYDAGQFSPTIESSGDASFSATLKINDAGDTAYAELYNKTNSTTVAEVSHTGNTNWTYKITTNIDADADWDTTNDDDYVVRVKCVDNNGGGCSANISNAKIHLNQYDSGGITDLEVVHHQIASLRTDADTTYTNQNNPYIYNPDLSTTQRSFAGGALNYFYEATLKTSAGTGYARLLNDSNNTAITNAELTTTSTSYERKRSSDITTSLPQFPQSGTKTLDSQLKNSATNTTSVTSSALIIQVSGLATNGVTAYADLYNLTDSAVVSNSEISTTSSSWTLLHSPTLTLTTGKQYVVRTKSSVNGAWVHLLNAKLILSQNDDNGVTLTELIWPMVNASKTDADATYTDQDSFLAYNPDNINPHFYNVYFESTLKTSAGTGYAQLKNHTDNTAISGSEVTTTSTSYERKRSSALQTTLPAAAKTLDTQLKNSATNTTTAASSWLIVQANKSYPVVTHDSTVQKNHGSIENASWEQTCINSSCLKYDGTDDYVWVHDDTNNFDFIASQDFTLTGWFKTGKSSTTQILMAKYESTGTDGGYKVYLNSNGTISFGIDDDNTSFPEDVTTTTTTYDNSVWHHFAAIKDGTTSITLYIDGLPVAEDSLIAATGSLANDDKLYFGIDGDGSSNPFSGWLDEFKVYPYARTADEIKTDYSGYATVLGISTTNKSLTDNLVLHWPLDETATPAVDSTGNQNSGTWQGNAAVATGKLGSAIDLDGTSDYISSSTAVNIPSNTTFPSAFINWTKRKPITITETSGSTLTNYQVKITVSYSYGMQTDFDDLRFTNSAGTELDYWLESKTDTSTATVWVEVDSLPASANTTIYMYYGNPGATSNSNGSNVFAFFDDFSGASLGASWTTSGGTWVQSDGILSQTLTTAGEKKAYVTTSGANFVVEALVRPDVLASDYRMGLAARMSGGSGYNALIKYDNLTQLIILNDGCCWGTPQATGFTYTTGNWYKFAFGVNGNNQYAKSWLPANSEPSSWTVTQSYTGRNDATAGLNGGWNGSRVSFDNFFVRQFVSSIPTYSISSEQQTQLPPLSLSAWLNADTLGATDRIVFARGNDTDGYSWYIKNDAANPGKLKFTSDGGATTGLSATTLTTGNWYHIAITVDATSTKLYINGNLDSTVTHSGTLPGTGNISLGADDDGGNGMDGKLDDFRIYARALTAADIQNLAAWTLGPVGYWKLDENIGTAANDISGHGLTATLTGNPTWTVGKFGSGLSFDGSDDYLDIGTGPTQINTLMFWVKPTTTTESILDLNGTAYISISSGTLSASGFTTPSYYINGVLTTSPTLAANTWTHVAITTATSLNATDMDIGRLEGTDYFSGLIDEVIVYNSVRSAKEIIQDMNAGHPAPGSPVGSAVGKWNFDEGYGDTANNSGSGGTALNGNLAGSGTTCPTTGACPTWSNSGKFGKALEFDSSDDYVNAGSSSELDNIFSNGGTIEAWIYPHSLGENSQGVIFDKSSNGTNGGWWLQLLNQSNNKTRLYFLHSFVSSNQYNYWYTNYVIALNQWNHFVIVYDNNSNLNSPSVYVNGNLVAVTGDSSLTGAGNSDAANSLYMGNLQNGVRTFDGIIDEVRFYNLTMTADQVKAEFNQGKAQVMGATSTDASGTASNSSSDAYCPPGQGTTCVGPVAEWKFDENQGTAANDTSGNGNTGTLTNGPVWSTGKIGGAINFDGGSTADDYIVSGNGSTIANIFDGGGSISGWFYARSDGEADLGRIIGKTSSWFIATGHHSGNNVQLVFEQDFQTNAAYWYTPNFSINSWHHFSITYDNGSTSNDPIIYIDGKSVALTETNTASGIRIDDSSISLYLGNSSSIRTFDGYLDEIKIYNYGRTPAQIAWDYNRGKPTAHYRLDECTGTTANNASGTGYPGTITIGGTGDNTSAGTCNSGVTTESWHNGTTGKRNASLDFDGTDDYVDIGTGPTTVNAVSFWIKPTTTTEYPLDLNGTAYISASSGTLSATGFTSPTYYINGAATTSPTLTDGVWQHVTVTTATALNATDLDIGRIEGVGYMDGQLDDIKLYNYVPTTQQILTEFNQGAVNFGE